MPISIPDEVMVATHMTEPEIKRELAVALFQQEKLTLAQARRLGMSYLDFQALLADREIPIHYGVEEMEEDLRTIARLRER